ncbi:mitogen-activated protein kinase kinase kinase 1-like isoform X2 [Babylonia areolata]|uniref:mitogen-activated protein kinase kinase kinase 1-like isoform X2 n=1 Tax=Babylonia areolata TaxID=304850 RepID=UPI003FD2B75A
MATPAESAAAEEAASVNHGAAAAEEEDYGERSENFQGPHKWRQHLRHVNVPKFEGSDKHSDTADLKEISDRKLSVVSEEDQTQDKNTQKTEPEIPPWRQEYLEKKKTRQAGKVANTGCSQIPVSTLMRRKSQHLSGAESAFTRQVVNNGTNARSKKLSPSNSFRQANQSASSTSAGRRTPSQGDAPSTYLTQKRIERVQRARLYLLQQTGPNSFLIGGDSPDHKFRVIIGPQTCSCGRGPHCVHVLFVMLRVFQVGESDPCLWSKTLKNYEVENLFRIYHDKRSLRLTRRRQEKAKENSTPEEGREPVAALLEEANTPSENDTGSTREEEDTCPICLLEMLEGESLIKCENGCHNRLHHHCIAIWFEECRRQNDPLSCPLCRTPWTTSTTEIKTTHSESSDVPEVPPNTRSSSPQPSREESDGRLPHAEPVAQEFQPLAGPWIEALGEDLVNCLFSRNWSFRETGLKHLSKEIVATLLRSAGEGRSGAIVSPPRQAATHAMLETASKILAHMCGDPVYRVFVACLRSVRMLLSYTPCRDEHQRQRLQKLLTPIVGAIFHKCTDGNRRTSQLSLSTLLELAKGQAGELAVGREIVNPGTEGLHGLDFVVRCATEDYELNAKPWQWLLGRLYVIDKLMEEFPNEFLPRQEAPDSAGAAEDVGEAPEEAGAAAGEYPPRGDQQPPLVNYERLMRVAHFSVKAVCSSHMRIARMSRRVFLMSGKLGSHIDTVIDQLEDLLNNLSASSSILSLKRKLRRIVADFQLSEKIVHELQHGCEKLAGGRFESSNSTPLDSPVSTPRCNSPNTVGSEEAAAVVGGEGGGKVAGGGVAVEKGGGGAPAVPPNTPTHRTRRKLRRHSARRSFRDATVVKAPPASPDESQAEVSDRSCEMKDDVLTVVENSIEMRTTLPHTPPNPPRTLACLTPVIKVRPPSTSEELMNIVRHTEDLSLNLHIQSDLPSVSQAAMAEEHMVLDEGEIKTPPDSALPPPETETETTTAGGARKCCCACHNRESGLYDDAASQTSGTAAVPNSPESFRNRFHTAEQESMSSDDFLEFSTPSSSTNEKPVSFKSEVAESPKSSPSHTLSEASGNGECACKEEVEKEEAEALAKAMEVSEVQTPIPIVPGLTPTAREEVITIRIQPDDMDSKSMVKCSLSSGSGGESWCQSQSQGPQMYYEGIHWIKGPLLGTGAFSTCYQARDAQTGVLMAVKQISFCRNSSTEQESVVEAITAEIHMMARLSHPNVVRILGATKQGCHFNMFVEWMSGGSLSYLLGQYGAFTEAVTIRYTRQILRGLAYLHDNHVLHRDLKGANLLVDSTGQQLRIGDFGASARLASQHTGAGEFQGQLLGTIAFMAPEVLRGESYGRACDVWSVGCVMIEMSTCRPPWNSHDISNHLALIFKIASSVAPPPIPDNLSPPVRDLMLRCLEQKSEDRPPAKDLLMHPLFTKFSNY